MFLSFVRMDRLSVWVPSNLCEKEVRFDEGFSHRWNWSHK